MRLPPSLIDCYSLERFDDRLADILLSKYGIFVDSEGFLPATIASGRNCNDSLYGCFCDDCLPVIMQDVKMTKIAKGSGRSHNDQNNVSLNDCEDSKCSDDEISVDDVVDAMSTDDTIDTQEPTYKYTDKPPIYAIANGNYIGHLPDQFQDLSRSEEAAVALMVVCIYLSTIVSSHMSVINSHHYIIKNPDPVIRCIPASTAGTVRVAMVGAFTEEKEAKV